MASSDLYAKRLAVLQSFKEVTWGTPAAATAKWMGVDPYPTFKTYRKSELFNELRGSLAPAFLSAILRKGGEFNFGGYVTYEDIILPLHALFGIVSPSGAGPYVYTYNGMTGTAPTLQTYSFESMLAGAYVNATGSIANKMTITGAASQPLKYTLSGFCQDIDPAAAGSPAALSDRAVEVALMPTTALSMDASGGTIGTTAFAGLMTDFSLEMENSAKPVYTAGSLTPLHWVVGDTFKSTLTLGVLYTSAVRTFINTTLMTGGGALIQLKTTSGVKIITVNFAGVLADDPELYPEKEGAVMATVKLSARYDSAAALYTSIIATNSVAAVP